VVNDEFRFYEAVLAVDTLTGQNEETHTAFNTRAVLLGQWKCSRTPLIRTPVIRIDLSLRVNLSRILQNYLALKFPIIWSNTVQFYGF